MVGVEISRVDRGDVDSTGVRPKLENSKAVTVAAVRVLVLLVVVTSTTALALLPVTAVNAATELALARVLECEPILSCSPKSCPD
jgi:hypothetical protein